MAAARWFYWFPVFPVQGTLTLILIGLIIYGLAWNWDWFERQRT